MVRSEKSKMAVYRLQILDLTSRIQESKQIQLAVFTFWSHIIACSFVGEPDPKT